MRLCDGSGQPGDAEAAVAGRAINAVVDGIGQFSTVSERATTALLTAAGLPSKPEPQTWYPMDAYLRGIEAVLAELGPSTVERAGEHVAVVVEWPGPTDSVAAAMETLVRHYEQTHRGGAAGSFSFERTDATTGRVRCGTPYPCPLERGVVRGLAHRAGTGFVTVTEVGHCREQGSDACTYDLSW